jgi:hypothetical protein
MDEEKLAEEIKKIHELALGDKKIDVASLMINALQKHQANLLPVTEKRWAYFLALGVPPLGLLFAIKFYLSDKDDAKDAAMMCVLLTAVSILFLVLFLKVFTDGSGANLDKLQQIKPQDIQEFVQ